MPADRPPAGTTVVAFSTTADAPGAAARAGGDVRWSASDGGLARREGGRTLRLLEDPVLLEAWTGEAWTRDIRGAARALRLTFSGPAESVLIR